MDEQLLEGFRRQDISIPFPQREVRVLGSRS
jgi:small-conductance mechanosensitive channel